MHRAGAVLDQEVSERCESSCPCALYQDLLRNTELGNNKLRQRPGIINRDEEAELLDPVYVIVQNIGIDLGNVDEVLDHDLEIFDSLRVIKTVKIAVEPAKIESRHGSDIKIKIPQLHHNEGAMSRI